MPQRRNSAPPEVMTWPKASPVLAGAAVVDAIRAFFHFFWFFGPAVAIFYCTLSVSERLSSWTLGLLGTKTAVGLCGAVGAAVGAAGIEIIGPFGVIMANAVGLMGFLALGLCIVMLNKRLFKTAASAPIQFAGAFAVGGVPFLGAFPVFTFILWRLHRAQIKTEQAARQKWEQETSAARLQERNQQTRQVAQLQAGQMRADVQQRQIVEREEAEYADYQRKLAANDGQYEIPEDEKKAA